MSEETIIKSLFNNFPNHGAVAWIGIRPERNASMSVLQEVRAIGSSLEGDHYSGNVFSNRHVTLIQAEHIKVVAEILRKDSLEPELLRRNIVVKGINLLALKNLDFQIGEAVLRMSGLCHPCSRMEKNLGFGGYNAMRGHGGITAKIVDGGIIRVGDKIFPVS